MPTTLAALDEKTAAWQQANPEKASRSERLADELWAAVTRLLDGAAGAGAAWSAFTMTTRHRPWVLTAAFSTAIRGLAYEKRQQGATLTALEQRISALERKKELRYAGVWTGGTPYPENTAVTFRGSLWIARRDTTNLPGGLDSGWQLAVKCGRDGAPGKNSKDAGDPS